MNAIWYRVSLEEITPVQVSKVTDKFVYTVDDGYGERRNAINSGWGDYYPTRAQAVAALVRKYQFGIEQARRTMVQGETNLQRLQQEYPAEYADGTQQQQEAA
jgi:hypothetical protein